MKLTPNKVSAAYDAGISFNTGIDLYETVETNENFFVGRQWEGVKSNGLPTPVFNFLKRVVLFSVANIATDNLKLRAKPLPSTVPVPTRVLDAFSSIINDQFAAIFENNRISGLVREFCRNAAVDGDGCMYTYWDPNVETGQVSKGGIKTEILQNTQVLFGNPNCRRTQDQPYIILERRLQLDAAKKRAKEDGNDPDEIVADKKESGNTNVDNLGGDKVTVLTYLWKDEKTGTVWAYECTRTAVVKKKWDLGIDLYPLVWMNWDYVQDSYHGQAMITGLIPNQIFVNKLFAMSMISLMSLAYPKVVYDRTKVAKWSAKVGAAIGVNGSVDGVAKIIDPAAISPQISQFIDIAISYTQKFLGASDVALGDTRPDNAAAIIALQRAAATPMELTRGNLVDCMEQLGRIYKAFMAEYYGKRYVEVKDPESGQMLLIRFDFSMLQEIPCSIDIDAGESAYWSEVANIQTLDNLLMQNKISTSEYLRRLPNGHISDKEALIAVTEAAERGEMLPVENLGLGGGAPIISEETAPLRGGSGNGALQRMISETGEVPRLEA